MWRTIIIYGVAMAVLLGLLKVVEYQYFVRDIPLEFYIGAVAVMFTGLGIWAGLRLTRPKLVEVEVNAPFERDDQAVKKLGISKREFEVLELIAAVFRIRRSLTAFLCPHRPSSRTSPTCSRSWMPAAAPKRLRVPNNCV
jgi:hypothetical protein